MMAAAGETPATMKKIEFLGNLLRIWSIIDMGETDLSSKLNILINTVKIVAGLNDHEFSDLMMLLQGVVLGQKIILNCRIVVWDELLSLTNDCGDKFLPIISTGLSNAA